MHGATIFKHERWGIVKRVQEAHANLGGSFPISYVNSWHCHPKLIDAIADRIQAALEKFPAPVRADVPIIFTAHSLPNASST